jgi:hypothetical protein
MHWFCRTTYPRLRPTRCLFLAVPIHRRAWATNPSLHQRTVERGGVPPEGLWIVGTVADLGRLRQGSPMIRGYRSPINALSRCAAPLSFSLANAQWPARQLFPTFLNRSFSWRRSGRRDHFDIGCGSLAGSVGLRRHLRSPIARVRGTATDVRERAETARRLVSLCQAPHKRYQRVHSSCRRRCGHDVLLRAARNGL